MQENQTLEMPHFLNACITWRSLCGPYGGLLKLAAPGNQGLLAPSKEFNILSEESDGCGKIDR